MTLWFHTSHLITSIGLFSSVKITASRGSTTPQRLQLLWLKKYLTAVWTTVLPTHNLWPLSPFLVSHPVFTYLGPTRSTIQWFGSETVSGYSKIQPVPRQTMSKLHLRAAQVNSLQRKKKKKCFSVNQPLNMADHTAIPVFQASNSMQHVVETY